VNYISSFKINRNRIYVLTKWFGKAKNKIPHQRNGILPSRAVSTGFI